MWQLDQLFKPDQVVWEGDVSWSYAYSGSPNDPPPWTNFSKSYASYGMNPTVTLDIVNNLFNRYEVMSLAAESWTTALGATPSVLNLVGNVNLGRSSPTRIWPIDAQNPSSPYGEHFYHSAEFRGGYWQQQGYWNELLGAEGFHLK